MIGRVTAQTMLNSSHRNLQSANAELARLQNQASSGKRIGQPSDDPSGTAAAMKARAAQQANQQFSRNAEDGLGWVTEVDSTLTSATALLRRARDLTVQGANDGALSPSSRESIAVELESIRAALLGEANSEYLGRSIFAGNSDAGHAYDAAYAFTGGLGSVDRRIGDGVTVRVDADGAAVFGNGIPNSVFAELDAIVADLRGGTNIGAHLTTLDARRDGMLAEQAKIGASHGTILKAKDTLLEAAVELKTQLAGVEDIDLGEIILELKMQETVYQSALMVTARTNQSSLMDFLR